MSKRPARDDLDKFHDYGIYLPTRTLYLGSEEETDSGESGCDAQMAKRLIKNLHILDTMSQEPITIILNNPGGDTYNGFAIYDAIARCRSQVRVEVLGQTMSMGSVILQAADERVMGPHATQMIHYGTISFDGESRSAAIWSAEEQRISLRMEAIYLAKIQEKHPSFTLKKLRKKLDRDTFLSAEESVSLGLADSVLGAEDE